MPKIKESRKSLTALSVFTLFCIVFSSIQAQNAQIEGTVTNNSIPIPFITFDNNGDVVATADNPFALTFDPTYVYGPNQGIRGFFGLRYRLN